MQFEPDDNLRTPLGEGSLFAVIATLGAPLEVTAADLATETFLPMDEPKQGEANNAPVIHGACIHHHPRLDRAVHLESM